MKRNQDYKNAGLAVLNGNWKQAILATFILLVISELMTAANWAFDRIDFSGTSWGGPVFTSFFVMVMLSFLYFLVLPLSVGFINTFNRLYCDSDNRILENLRKLSFHEMSRSAIVMLLMGIVTWFCSLLLFIPGVIASLSLFLTPYLLKDYPKMSAVQVLRLSHKMMQGHKMQLFMLQLSFIGWILLNILTLGIGSLWLTPYMLATFAAFYQDVKAEYLKKEGQQESAL